MTFTERLLLKLSLKLLDVQSFHGKNLILMKCHFINALGGMVGNHKSSKNHFCNITFCHIPNIRLLKTVNGELSFYMSAKSLLKIYMLCMAGAGVKPDTHLSITVGSFLSQAQLAGGCGEWVNNMYENMNIAYQDAMMLFLLLLQIM